MPVTLVTGAASGIGRRLAERLAARPDELVVGADLRTHDTGDEAITLDVTDPGAWETTLDRVVERHGAVDRLCNVAGAVRPASVVRIQPEDVAAQLQPNLAGVIHGTVAAARRMTERGEGHIVNVASLAGLSPTPGLGVYAATKFGVRGFSLSAALDLRGTGVAVTVVCPDLTDTPMLDLQIPDDDAAVSFSGRRALTTDEVAEAVIASFRRRPLEVTLPAGRSGLARLAGTFPRFARTITPVVIAVGRRRQRRLRHVR